MRKTHALVQVAMALMADPSAHHWGYDLSKRAGVRAGVLYPLLQRMFEAGWLEDGWEDRSQISGRRPARRYYELTAHGKAELGAVLEQARHDARFAALIRSFA